MSPESKFGLFIWTWKESIKAGRKPVVFLPFLVYAFVQFFMVAGLIFFMYPPFSFLFMPVQRALGGEMALHYPNYFLVLPQAFESLNLALSGILGIGVVGLATLLFAAGDRLRGLREEVETVAGRYGHLFGAWLGETVLSLAVIFGFARLAGEMPEIAQYLNILRMLCVILVSTLFAFTSVLIMLERQPFARAIVHSLKLFANYGVLTFFLVGLPSLLQLPVQFVLARSAVIVQKLNPEIIAAVVSAGIFAAMISNYFIIGAITNLYRIVALKTQNGPKPEIA
ncbi:hypothetical protein HUU05_05775 [candidate division KSB1 bacterium]|nr:hypothetical protein [candidate division KSB1 bacterium]